MIFAIQISGKYGGDAAYNSLMYVASNGNPGDTVVCFGTKIWAVFTFDEYMEKMDDIQRCFNDGSLIMPLMEWYHSDHSGSPMTILSNAHFSEGHFHSVDDFEEWAYLNLMPSVANITWFNPFLSEMGNF